MAKWVIILVGLALAVGVGAGTAFALTGDGAGNIEVEPDGGIGSGAGPPHADPPIRSDEDIDPDECNLVHNINACDEDDLKALGGAPILGSTPLASGTEVEGEPEPLYVDGEPQYEVQSHEDAVEQDCGLAGGSVYVSSDGEVGCVIVHDLEDGGEEETQGQLPQVEPQVEPQVP